MKYLIALLTAATGILHLLVGFHVLPGGLGPDTNWMLVLNGVGYLVLLVLFWTSSGNGGIIRWILLAYTLITLIGYFIIGEGFNGGTIPLVIKAIELLLAILLLLYRGRQPVAVSSRPAATSVTTPSATAPTVGTRLGETTFDYAGDVSAATTATAASVAAAAVDRADDAVVRAEDVVDDAYDATVDTASDAVEYTADRVGDAYDATTDAARDAADAVGDRVEGAYDATVSAADRAGDSIAGAYDATVDAARDAADAVGDRVEGAYDAAVDAADRAGDSIAGAYDATADATRDAAGYVGDRVEGAIDATADVAGDVVDAADDALDAVGDAVRGGAAAVGATVGSGVDSVEDMLDVEVSGDEADDGNLLDELRDYFQTNFGSGSEYSRPIEYIEGIGAVYGQKLRAIDINTVLDLILNGATRRGRKQLSDRSGISQSLILTWVNHVDLFRIKGVAQEYADLLEESGVDTVVELAQRNPGNLHKRMVEVNEQKALVRRTPHASEVESWVDQAKQLRRVIHY